VIHGTETFICKDLYFEMNSTPRRFLEMFQVLNLMYIGIAIPLHVSFGIKLVGVPFLLEAVSLIFSVLVIFLNFRTPVIVKGETTLELKKVAKYYW